MVTHEQPQLETPEGANRLEAGVEVGMDETSKDVKSALKRASGKGKAVSIANVQIADPDRAYENLKAALGYVKKMVHFSERDLYFTKFGGQTVGELKKDGKVQIDAIMLMHPACRLAHVIVHELSHSGDVENEGLVEARTRVLLQKAGLLVEDDGVKTTEAYDDALSNFHEFARRVGGDKETGTVVEEIYKLYYSGKYETIYEMYEKKYIERLRSDEGRNEALEFFEIVFPELSVQRDGCFEVRDFPL